MGNLGRTGMAERVEAAQEVSFEDCETIKAIVAKLEGMDALKGSDKNEINIKKLKASLEGVESCLITGEVVLSTSLREIPQEYNLRTIVVEIVKNFILNNPPLAEAQSIDQIIKILQRIANQNEQLEKIKVNENDFAIPIELKDKSGRVTDIEGYVNHLRWLAEAMGSQGIDGLSEAVKRALLQVE